jgi:hypothetical protein
LRCPARVVISATNSGVESDENSAPMGHSLSLLFRTVSYQKQRETQGKRS